MDHQSAGISVDFVRPYEDAYTSFGPCRFRKVVYVDQEITSVAGPVVIHAPATLELISDSNVIDCNGATLVNVGGITTDVDDITIMTPYVTTVDNATAALTTYTTILNGVFVADLEVIGKDTTTSSTLWTFTDKLVLNNTAGTVHVSVLSATQHATGTQVTVDVSYTVLADALTIRITGETGHTIRWKARLHMLRDN